MRWVIFHLSCVAFISLLSLNSIQAQTLPNCQPAPPMPPNVKPGVVVPTAVAFSNDGKLLVASSVGLDQKQTSYLFIETLVWTTNTGEKLFTIEGHKVDVPALIFSKDDRYLLTGSVDTTIKFWDMKTGLLSKTFTIPPSQSASSR